MGISDVFAVIGGFIVVLSAIGVGLALVRGSYTKARIEALRGDNEDLRNTANDLRQKVTDLENHREHLSERVSHLEDANAMLHEMVTQRADVETVKEILEGHHQKAMEGISMMSRKADRLLGTTDAILHEVRDNR